MTYPQAITLACSILSILISCLSLWLSRAAIRRARGVDAALDQVEQLLADRIATWGRDGEDGFSVNGGIGGKGGKGGGVHYGA